MQTFRTYQTSFLDNPVWFPGLDYGIVRAELPKRVDLDEDVQNHFITELGRAILRQALQDCHDTDIAVRNDARKWIINNGEQWADSCDIDFIDDEAIQQHLQHGKTRIKKSGKHRRAYDFWGMA